MPGHKRFEQAGRRAGDVRHDDAPADPDAEPLHRRGGHAAEYVDYNHADVGFEGIRAQDILPALLQRFHFEVFCPWGGIMLPFIERRFGWNYDPQRAEDRAIIDAIAGRDAQLLAEGKVKPTQLVASMRLQPVPLRATFPHAPKDCVRMP